MSFFEHKRRIIVISFILLLGLQGICFGILGDLIVSAQVLTKNMTFELEEVSRSLEQVGIPEELFMGRLLIFFEEEAKPNKETPEELAKEDHLEDALAYSSLGTGGSDALFSLTYTAEAFHSVRRSALIVKENMGSVFFISFFMIATFLVFGLTIAVNLREVDGEVWSLKTRGGT